MLQRIIRKLTLGKGALIRAAMLGDADSVLFCLLNSTDPNTKNRKGMTPLACAALNGHEEIVNLLLKAGADPNSVIPIGGTALCAAARNNHIEIMSKLIGAGADVNSAGPELLITPLMGVAGHGHLKAVNLLLAAGADPLLAASSGDTASSLAALHGFQEVAQVLKDAELKRLHDGELKHKDGDRASAESGIEVERTPEIRSARQKDHELGINVVGNSITSEGGEVLQVNYKPELVPQMVAEIEGEATLIVVKTVQAPERATLASPIRKELLSMAENRGMKAAFAPVELLSSGQRNDEGEVGFFVKYEGLEMLGPRTSHGQF